MILIQASNVSKSFGAEPILTDIQLTVQQGERIGLIGANGAGKSTLLQIMIGQLQPDQGSVHVKKGASVGYLAQHSGLTSERTIWEEMLTVFSDLRSQEKELRRLEKQMAETENPDAPAYEQLLEHYASLAHTFEEQGGYRYEADIRGVLHGLNFQAFDYENTPVEALSGGQKTRLALAKLLLTRPDVLMLDEPTNYLDIDTMTWLEQYLEQYEGAILVVSHDRYFLDRLTNVIYEIEGTKARRFTGNYSAYVKQKETLREKEWKAYEKQQEEIARAEDFIQRNIARASTSSRAKSRRKMLEKTERLDKPLTYRKQAGISFDIAQVSGNDVLKVEDLSIGYEDKRLLSHLSFELRRGERAALFGPNGIGKTTLMKTIVGKHSPFAGRVQLGSKVNIGYYDQEQEGLHPEKTILHELWDEFPSMDERDIRTVLGQFLFEGDEVKKQVHTLSGGEKARLSLSKLMLKQANFLIMDEPTNHLDVYNKEALEEALEAFPGTLLFISHDRYFLNKIATRLIELEPSGVKSYLGNYDYFVEKKAELEELTSESSAEKPSAEPLPQTDKQLFEEQKQKQKEERKRHRRIETLEKDIALLENEIEEIEQELCKPEVYTDPEQVQPLNEKLEEYQNRLETAMEEWETLLQEDEKN